MIIDWDAEAAGKTYHYTHKRSYDLVNQVYRDDQMDGDKIVTSTVYRPGDKLAYQYGSNGCVTWDFESKIDGFPPVDGYAFNLTDKVVDEFSKTFYDPKGEKVLYRLDIWFVGGKPSIRDSKSHVVQPPGPYWNAVLSPGRYTVEVTILSPLIASSR